MTYEEVLKYMNKRWKSTMHLGLSRISALLQELGNPQKFQDYIHVAGTNGKGSTVTAIASILAMSGKKVGIYTSPYLERFTDRIRILDGAEAVHARAADSAIGEISEKTIAELFTEILSACDRIVAAGGEEASEFEVLTAAALLYFRREGCDVVVLETGLGGRLDATNVIDFAKVTVISALGYDHCAVLGNSMEAIVAEKAAIIKAGTDQVLLYDPEAAAGNAKDAKAIFETINRRCEAMGAPLTVVKRDEISGGKLENGGQSFYLRGYKEAFFTPLLGEFQLLNAALAIRAVVAYAPELKHSPALYEGLRWARWPGRMELFQTEPAIILDGAHNPQAASALVKSIKQLYPERALVLLIAVLEDKDYLTILQTLKDGLKNQTQIIVCTQPGVKRDLPASELATFVRRIWTRGKAVAIIEQSSIEAALLEARQLAMEKDAMILACGSLYLVSTVRSLVQEWKKVLPIRQDKEN